METGNGTTVHPEHVTPHRHEIRPIDRNYHLVVRTVLWVIAGIVFLGFAIWWTLT